MNKELLEYFNGDELAANVWLTKYAADGETLPTDMFKRMATEFARVDVKYQKLEEGTKDLSKYGQQRDDTFAFCCFIWSH